MIKVITLGMTTILSFIICCLWFLLYFFILVTVIFVVLYICFLLLNMFSKRFSYIEKHVVITGGSSGIGYELAKEYLRLGANVSILARNETKLQEKKALLDKLINDDIIKEMRIMAVSVDVSSSEEEVKKAFLECTQAFGEVDVLVNCAGVSIAAPFDEINIDEFDRMYKINVLGSVYPTRAVIEGMKKKYSTQETSSDSGRIIFVSSQVAQAAIYGYTAYAASKWAIRGLAEALQMELKPFNILVSVAYPPDTDTPGYKEEMLTKPLITRKLSESGSIFSASDVAKDIIRQSSAGYYSLSTGFDGWMLKQLHPGMSPVNNICEALEPVFFTSVLRLVALGYVWFWSYTVAQLTHAHTKEKKE